MSHRPLLALIALLLLLAACVAPAHARNASVVQGSYIVALKDSVSDPGATTRRLERRGGFKANLRYRHALKGFAARLSARQVSWG